VLASSFIAPSDVVPTLDAWFRHPFDVAATPALGQIAEYERAPLRHRDADESPGAARSPSATRWPRSSEKMRSLGCIGATPLWKREAEHAAIHHQPTRLARRAGLLASKIPDCARSPKKPRPRFTHVLLLAWRIQLAPEVLSRV